MFSQARLRYHQQVLREIEAMLRDGSTAEPSVSDHDWATAKVASLLHGVSHGH